MLAFVFVSPWLFLLGVAVWIVRSFFEVKTWGDVLQKVEVFIVIAWGAIKAGLR